MTGTLTKLHDGGHFYEAPRWHDGRWWVSDFYAHEVITVDPDGHSEFVMRVPGQPSGLGWMPDGSLLVVSMRDGKILRRSPGGDVSEHADISQYITGLANDMVVDADGRAYVGNFGFDLMGGADPQLANLVRVDPDGSTSVAAKDLYFPNGAVLADDGATLVVGETMGNRYSAFPIGDDGELGPRSDWVSFGDLPELGTLQETMAALTIAPDGCGLADDDSIWCADALGGRVVNVTPAGADTGHAILAPEGLGFYACAVGGPDGKTLLICAAPDFYEEARKAATEAVLYTVEL